LTERMLGVVMFWGFGQTEWHRHLLPLLKLEQMIDSCNGFGRRLLEHESLVLQLVLDVEQQHLYVLDSFEGHSRQRLLLIGYYVLLPRCLQGYLGHMGYR
jgi:hypothetical protein